MRVFFFHGVLEKKRKIQKVLRNSKEPELFEQYVTSVWVNNPIKLYSCSFLRLCKTGLWITVLREGGVTPSGMWYITRLHVGSYRNHEEYKYAHAS